MASKAWLAQRVATLEEKLDTAESLVIKCRETNAYIVEQLNGANSAALQLQREKEEVERAHHRSEETRTRMSADMASLRRSIDRLVSEKQSLQLALEASAANENASRDMARAYQRDHAPLREQLADARRGCESLRQQNDQLQVRLKQAERAVRPSEHLSDLVDYVRPNLSVQGVTVEGGCWVELRTVPADRDGQHPVVGSWAGETVEMAARKALDDLMRNGSAAEGSLLAQAVRGL